HLSLGALCGSAVNPASFFIPTQSIPTIAPTHPHREVTMRRQSFGALGFVLLGAVTLFAVARPPQPPGKGEPKREVASKPLDRVLPGLRKDGFVQLPNQWSLKPAGRQVELGDFPVNVAIHPSGEFAAALCAGYREHEAIIVDLNPDRPRVVSRVQID